MKIVGCDLHAKQQSIALLDTETGELIERTLVHEANQVEEFYSSLGGPVMVGIEATGAMQWFLQLMEELEIECRKRPTLSCTACRPLSVGGLPTIRPGGKSPTGNQ